jgi:hypothetical protein
MDSLTFGSLITLRHMTFSEARYRLVLRMYKVLAFPPLYLTTFSVLRKMPIQEFHLNKILEELSLSKDEVSYRNLFPRFRD